MPSELILISCESMIILELNNAYEILLKYLDFKKEL